MKLLKWISLGVGMWATSLVWPEINLALSLPLTVGLIALSGLGLVLVGLLALVEQHLTPPASLAYLPVDSGSPARPAHRTRPLRGEVSRPNPTSRPTRPVAI